MGDTTLLARLDDCRRYPSSWSRVEMASLARRAYLRIEELEIDRDNLRKALEWIAEEVMVGGDINDLDWFDTMVSLGLLVKVSATKEFCDEWGEDTMYVLAWKAEGDKP